MVVICWLLSNRDVSMTRQAIRCHSVKQGNVLNVNTIFKSHQHTTMSWKEPGVLLRRFFCELVTDGTPDRQTRQAAITQPYIFWRKQILTAIQVCFHSAVQWTGCRRHRVSVCETVRQSAALQTSKEFKETCFTSKALLEINEMFGAQSSRWWPPARFI